ncbi:unnamed protein product [Heterobilharzia americana]|nr:unnamed protein product [Heterobilharzia americana]
MFASNFSEITFNPNRLSGNSSNSSNSNHDLFKSGMITKSSLSSTEVNPVNKLSLKRTNSPTNNPYHFDPFCESPTLSISDGINNLISSSSATVITSINRELNSSKQLTSNLTLEGESAISDDLLVKSGQVFLDLCTSQIENSLNSVNSCTTNPTTTNTTSNACMSSSSSCNSSGNSITNNNRINNSTTLTNSNNWMMKKATTTMNTSVFDHSNDDNHGNNSKNNNNEAMSGVVRTPVHPRTTLKCPFCDKIFSNSSAIAKHKLTHSEERKYICGICHKAFKRQDHLNGHKYTHESRKPHACHFCDKSYSDSRSLRRHYENAHPEENERWMLLCQATNGDTSAISVAAAAAAAALLSSTTLEADPALLSELSNAVNSSIITTSGSGDGVGSSSNSSTGSNESPLTLLTALSSTSTSSSSSLSPSSSVNKLIELGQQTGLSPAALVALVASTGSTSSLSSSIHRLERSSASKISGNTSSTKQLKHISNSSVSGKNIRSDHSMLNNSPSHSPHSLASFSNTISPNGNNIDNMDITDNDEVMVTDEHELSDTQTSVTTGLINEAVNTNTTSNTNNNNIVKINNFTLNPIEVANAAKVALLMAHPLEEPKRVACAICQKRFKNQSALNGHMRLHGGYGPAGLTGITTNSTVASSSSSSSTQSNQTHHHRSNSSGHGSSKSVSKLTDPAPYRTTSSNNNSGNNNNVNNNSDLKNKSSSTLTGISTLKSSSSQLSQLDTITASHTSLESISSVITTNTNTTYSCIMDNTSSSTPNVDTSGSISITVTTTPRTRDLTTTTTTAASSSLNNNNNNMDISSSLFNSAIVSQSNSENLHPSNNQSQINNTWSYIANKQILESTFNTSLHHSNISGTCGSDDTSVPLNRHKLQLQSENLTNNSISNQNCQQLSLYNSWLSPQFTVSSESVHSSSQHHQHQHQSLQHFHMDLSNFDDVIDINKKDNNNNSNNNSGLTSPRHHGSMDDESLLKYNRRLSFVCSSNMKMMTTTPGITTSTVTAIDSCHGHQFHSVTTPSVSATATLFDKHCMTSKTTSLASIHCLSTTITDRFNNSQKSELLGLMDTDDWWHPEIGNSLNSSNNINNNRGNNSNRSLNTNSFDQKWLSFENMTSPNSNNNNNNNSNNPKGITSFELFDTSDQKQTITIPPNIHLASRLKSENNQCHNSSVSSSLSAPFLLNQLSSSSSSAAAASSSSCAWSTQRKQTKSGFVRPIPQPLQLVSEANYQPQLGISSQYSPITPAPMNMSMHTIITDCETISSSSTLTTMKASNSVNVDPGLFHNDDEHQYRLIEGIVECNNNANTKSSVCCFDANGLDLSHFPDSLLLTSIYGSNTTTTTNSNNNNDHTNFIYPVDDNCSNDNLCKAIPIVSVSMSSGKVDSDIPLVNCANQSNDHLINLSQKRTDTNLQRYLHHHHPSTVPPPPPHHIHRQRQANNDGSSSSSICDSHGDCSVCCPIPKFSNPFEYSQHLHQHQQQQPERQVYQRQQSHSHLPHQHQQNICPVPALQSGISLSLSSYHHSGLQQHHDQGSSNHINNYDNGNNNIITRRITDPFVHTCSQYSHHQPTTINHLAGMNFMRHSLHQLNIPSIQSCNVTFTTCNSLLNSGCCPRINITSSSSSSCASSMIISSGLSSVRSSNFTHSVTSAIAAAVTTTTSTTVSPNNANNDHYSSANNFFNFTSDRLHYKPSQLRQQQQDLHSHLHQPPTMYQMISSNRGVESSSERVENTHLFNGSELMLNNKFHSVGNPSPPSHHHYNHPCQSNNNTNHNYKNLFTINNQSDSLVKHTYRNQCCLSCLEPERKRHISAPVANISSQSPFLLSLSALSVSTSLSSSSSLSYSPSSLFSSSTFPGNLSTLQRPVATGPKSEFLNKPCFCLQECHHHYHQHRNNNNNNNHHYHDHHQQQHSHCCAGLSSNELTSGVSVEQPSSDTVAELLMQSHITDPDGLSLTCEQQNSCPTTPDPPLTPIRSTTRIVVLPTNDQSLSTEDDHHHLNNNTNNTDDKYVYRHGNLTSHKSNIFSCSKPSIPSTLQSSPPLPQHKHHQHYQLHPLQPQSLSCLSCADSNNEQYQQRNYSQPPPYQYQQQQHQKLSVSLNLPVTTCSMSNLNQLDLLDLTVTSVMQNINDNNTTTINNNHNNADNLKNNTVVSSITCLDNNDHNTSNNNNVMSKYISDSDDHSGGHLSVAAKLSKSLAEDNLFRNPKALPPPKKLKSKPAPISIPPQTGANLSRLRSPRVWSSKGCSLDSSPPPYTPPPMLSPNRQGSGLFASLSRWSTTPTTSALTTLRSTVGYNNTILNRRYSSHYSSTGVAGTTSLSNSVYNDLDNQNNATGGQLKRRHASSSCSSGGTIGITASNQSINTMMDPGSSSADNHHNYDGNGDNINSGAVDSITDSYMRDLNRPIAYTRRRRQQLTPKSAPVLILNPNTNKNQTTQSRDVLQENDSINQSQPPIFSSSDTIFGYDDETMRRFAEADAVDEAYRLNRQKQRRDNHHSRRRCDTESNLSNITSIDHKTDTFNSNTVNDRLIFSKTDQSFNFAEEQLLNFDFEMKAVETNYSEATRIQFNEDVDFSSEGEMEDDDDDDEGVPTSIIPHINVGNAYQADIPEFCQAQESTTTTTPGKQDSSEWETLLWYPANLDEDDPKNIESLNLLMKIACSPAVRNCGLNMEYTFHLLCKYKGDLEMTLHALLRDTLVVYDYVYAETTAWTTEEIVRFQQGLAMHGRDFHQVAKYLQAAGMNKTVKACVEFYYVWKRMNTPSDVKWYRDRARRQRTTTTTSATRIEPIITEESLCEQFEAIEQQCNTFTDVNAIQSLENNSTTNVPYNLRRKHTTTTSATVSGTVTTQQPSIPVTAAPPPSANSRLHELVPVNNDSISNNNSGNTNDDNQMNNNSNDNVLENSYDDFMDIVFNDESFPISLD